MYACFTRAWYALILGFRSSISSSSSLSLTNAFTYWNLLIARFSYAFVVASTPILILSRM